MDGIRRGKMGGSGWVWVGSIGFAGQTGHGSKRVIFKRVNWVAGQVGLTRIFHFFFQLQKQINDNLFREND